MAEHLVFRKDPVSGVWIPLVLDGQQLKVESHLMPEMFTLAVLHQIDPCEFEGPSRIYVMGNTRYEPASVFNTPARTVSTDLLRPLDFMGP